MKKYVVLAALLTTASAPAFAQSMDGRTFRAMATQADAFEIAASRLALERSRNPRVRTFAQNMITDHGQTSQALNGGQAVYSASGEWLGGTVGGTLAGAGIGALVGGPVGAAVGAGVGATTGAVASAPSGGTGAGAVSGGLAGAGVGALVGGPVGAAVGAGVGATTGGAAGRAADIQATGSVAAAPIRLPVQLDAEKTQMLNQLASTTGPQFDRLYGRYQRAAHQETLALYEQYAQTGTDPALVTYARSVIPHLEHHLTNARRLPGAR
ncbi:DUF4142 domain-containing protein [Microvirga sp. 17 mud 1-3]|uniref:DUF4142 domain-containing protein n=1 Tax=Microvirga sp. 17 mud 1-3 TaxID=2082949 RepID=UPI000D6DA8C4|nr:DUF4142 domain-containing protein [Microvirga sp. 17 mud 1-3]AWM86155.1 DUF305 domain-containing protein [Microvirga sp. 17 mud 1-3]